MKNKKTCFLIVDDFHTMRDIIKNYLRLEGFLNIHMAANGAEAIKVLNKNKIDLIISDWNMPVMDGLELLKHIRSSERYPNVPLLMVTAETKKENISRAITAGINDFMVKPFTSGLLYQKVNAILAGKSPIQRTNRQKTNAPTTAPTEEQKVGTSQPAKAKKKDKAEILVVDDMSSNIDLIFGFLKDTYRLRAANNGKKAIKIIESDNPPDLILLDIMMPEMDGISVCKHIKKNPFTAEIPVIFLTAKTDKESLVEGFESGAVDYITKPVDINELKVRVKNHLQLKFSKEELKQQVDTLMENSRLRDDVERMSRHDLKTPISSIITLSSTLLEELPQANIGALASEHLHQIEASTFLLMDMVNQSLNLYKMEMGTYTFTPESIEIKNVLSKVINDLEGLAKLQGVRVDCTYNQDLIKCQAEELLCYSLFSNLLKNAVEASDKGAVVKIDLIQKEQWVLIKIENQGEIPEVVRDSFFSKYVTHGKKQGTGLGTYSAKLMTEVQNGEIQMESDAANGTKITVQFDAG